MNSREILEKWLEKNKVPKPFRQPWNVPGMTFIEDNEGSVEVYELKHSLLFSQKTFRFRVTEDSVEDVDDFLSEFKFKILKQTTRIGGTKWNRLKQEIAQFFRSLFLD